MRADIPIPWTTVVIPSVVTPIAITPVAPASFGASAITVPAALSAV